MERLRIAVAIALMGVAVTACSRSEEATRNGCTQVCADREAELRQLQTGLRGLAEVVSRPVSRTEWTDRGVGTFGPYAYFRGARSFYTA